MSLDEEYRCTVKRSKVFGPRHPVQGNWTQRTLHQGNWTQDILDPWKLDPRHVEPKKKKLDPREICPKGNWTQYNWTQDMLDPKKRNLTQEKFVPKEIRPEEI